MLTTAPEVVAGESGKTGNEGQNRPEIELKQVSQQKSGRPILTNINLAIAAAELVAVVGPSGAGKSSLFRLLNLLDAPAGGEIFYRGKNLTAYDPLGLRRQIGYLLPKPLLFGDKVADNLYYPYEITGQKPNEAEIVGYLERLGFTGDYLSKDVPGLSSGEQQRLALIRLLLVKPRVLLLDEFTSALDEENTRKVETLIRSEQARNNLTILFISHHLPQVGRLADKVVRLEMGAVKFYGSRERYLALYQEGKTDE